MPDLIIETLLLYFFNATKISTLSHSVEILKKISSLVLTINGGCFTYSTREQTKESRINIIELYRSRNDGNTVKRRMSEETRFFFDEASRARDREE